MATMSAASTPSRRPVTRPLENAPRFTRRLLLHDVVDVRMLIILASIGQALLHCRRKAPSGVPLHDGGEPTGHDGYGTSSSYVVALQCLGRQLRVIEPTAFR